MAIIDYMQYDVFILLVVINETREMIKKSRFKYCTSVLFHFSSEKAKAIALRQFRNFFKSKVAKCGSAFQGPWIMTLKVKGT